MSQHVFAVYDVSSSSVAGAHIVHTSTKSIVLTATHTQSVLQEEVQPARLLESVIGKVSAAIDTVRASDVRQPSHITVVLASPWYSTQTHTIVQKKEHPTVCTQELLDEIVRREIEQIMKDQQGAFSVFGAESVLVEKQITAIKLNGYPTAKPFGKKAVLIECTVTVTVAPSSVVQKITETIQRAYGIRPIRFISNVFADFVVVRDIDPKQYDSAVLVDIREEITDIAFMKDGSLLYHHSFPCGFHGVYRCIAEKTGISVQEAVTLFGAYRSQKLSDNETQKISDALDSFRATWKTQFHSVIDAGHYGFCLPQRCVVITNQVFHDMFTASIFSDEFVKHQCAVGPIEILQLDTMMLDHSIQSTNITPIETIVAIGALYSSHMIHI